MLRRGNDQVLNVKSKKGTYKFWAHSPALFYLNSHSVILTPDFSGSAQVKY